MADTVTTPGNSAGATRQLLRTSRTIGGAGRPVRADVVDRRDGRDLRFVSGGGDDHHAALLRVARRVLQVLQNGPLPGFIGAEVEIWVGKQAEIHDIEPLVARIAQRRRHRVGKAETGDRAGLQADDRGLWATPTMPMPFTRPAIVVAT